MFSVSAYKDPASLPNVLHRIFEKITTGFFVFIFGTMWFFSTKYYEKPKQYSIVAYDVLGNQNDLDGLKTTFRTSEVANSFVKEYQNRFPQYSFSLAQYLHMEKRRSIFDIIFNKKR